MGALKEKPLPAIKVTTPLGDREDWKVCLLQPDKIRQDRSEPLERSGCSKEEGEETREKEELRVGDLREQLEKVGIEEGGETKG